MASAVCARLRYVCRALSRALLESVMFRMLPMFGMHLALRSILRRSTCPTFVVWRALACGSSHCSGVVFLEMATESARSQFGDGVQLRDVQMARPALSSLLLVYVLIGTPVPSMCVAQPASFSVSALCTSSSMQVHMRPRACSQHLACGKRASSLLSPCRVVVLAIAVASSVERPGLAARDSEGRRLR